MHQHRTLRGHRLQARCTTPGTSLMLHCCGCRPPTRQQVDFDGDFPIEGAKEVATLMTRYVSRPVRLWAAAKQQAAAAAGGKAAQAAEAQAAAAGAGRLRVADGGTELTIEPARALA